MEKERKDDKDNGLEVVSPEANYKRKLKASNVYSDDSGSDSDSGSNCSNHLDGKHDNKCQSSFSSSGSYSEVNSISKLIFFHF